MAAPAIIEPIMQKDMMDCGIACLAMLLGLPYREVSDMAIKAVKEPHQKGMTRAELVRVGKLLGHSLITDQDFSGTGIMWVHLGRGLHCVVLFQNVVLDPASGMVYDKETYLASKHAKPWKMVRI